MQLDECLLWSATHWRMTDGDTSHRYKPAYVIMRKQYMEVSSTSVEDSRKADLRINFLLIAQGKILEG